MAGVRGLLQRVKQLEAAREMASPFQRWFGSLDTFAADTRAQIDAGKLDSRDMPVVLASIERWHREGLYG